MLSDIIVCFNERSTGIQVLILLVGGVSAFNIGVLVGRFFT